jgi:hypothetical protein
VFSLPDWQNVEVALPLLALNVEDGVLFRLSDAAVDLLQALNPSNALVSTPTPSNTTTTTTTAVPDNSPNSSHALSTRRPFSITREDAAFLQSIRATFTPPVYLRRLLLAEVHLRLTLHSSLAAKIFVGVRQMPVRLSQVVLTHVFSLPERLVKEIAANYLADAIVLSPVLLGSLDLLGNPTFLVESCGKGFQDLIDLPRHALPQGRVCGGE